MYLASTVYKSFWPIC